MSSTPEQFLSLIPESLQQTVANYWLDWSAVCEKTGLSPQAELSVMGKIWACSEFVARQCIRRPGMVDELVTEGLEAGRSADDYQQLVAQAIAAGLTDTDGIALAVASSRLSSQQSNPLVAQVQRNTHITRSGDIYIIQEPYWFLFDKGPVKAMHGSPWRYDTHVPIIFAGPTIGAQTVHRLVQPVDVAPTIAAFLGMTPPGSAQGSPLKEVLK